jgi:PAS domain S-box-containing protein
MLRPLRVLIVEDSPADAELIARELRDAGFDLDWNRVDTEAEYLSHLRPDLDIILSDYEVPQFGGPRALELLQARGLDVPFIIISGRIGEDVAVAVMKQGAADYLLKDRLTRLGPAVNNALEQGRSRKESKRAAAELRSTHEQLGHLLAHSPAVIYSLKIENHHVTPTVVSDNIERLLGVTVEESTHDWWLYSLHPDDRERVLNTLDESLSGDGYSMEYRIRHKNGSYHWVEDNNRVVRDEFGKATEAVGVWRDITKRKQAEVELKESERRFREMLENVELIAITLDKEGTVTFCNDYLLRVTGWKREEVIGADWFSNFIPDADVTVKKIFFESIEAGEIPAHRENPIKTKTGEVRAIVWNNTILRDITGNIVGTASLGEDVTERQQTEKALGRLRRQYELILQSVGEGIHGIGLDGKIIFENAAAAKLLGAQAEDLIGKPAHETIHHSHEDGSAYPKEECPIYQTLRDGAVRHSSKEFFWRSDGSSFPVDYVSAPLRDERGEIAGGVVTFRDITERKKAEDAIRESEERIRAILESALDCVITMDHQGRVVEFNPAAEKTFGYKRDEAIGQLLANLIIPSSLREHHERGLTHYLSTGEAPVLGKRVELTGMRSDRSEFPVELAITRIGSQEPPMFTGFIRDITERKQAEDRLGEQGKLLYLAQDAIMVRDMEDRVEFWNHGAENLYGWTAAEVQGKEASSFLYDDEPAATAAARAAVIENGIWTGECKHTCKDGGTVMVRSRWTLVRDELAAPKCILIINTDITEQKKIEEQFLRAQRLESIGTLASGVAHDLNNILVPILMAAPLLRGRVPAGERDKLLAIVQSSAERGASIVRQVLTFARGADGDRLLLQPIHLVQEIAKIIEETFPKSVAVRTNYPEDLWTIVADPTQLHQILLNLCINARDAMPTGGTLTLALENFEVDDHYASMTPGAKAGPHVLLEVSDTGTGIPRQTIDKIFDPFFTTKDRGQGTGLGLSTVIGIVKSHGGFIEVDSKVGRGSRFKVFLPANMSELAATQSFEAVRLPAANGELLLIVDDEKSILQVAKAILEGHGYRVLTAADATEALAIFALRMDEIELVLTDLTMPFMDGVALIRTLQKMKPNVRVIASTGRGLQDGRANEIADLNICASLTKPYNKNKLLKTLHDALSLQIDKQ